MEISECEENGVVDLQLTGEIDLHGSPALRKKLHEIAAAKTPALVVDVSGVSYIDSSGLATLVEYVRDAKPHGGKLALHGLQPKVRMVFELVRLNELFTIAADKASAFAAVKVVG
ncbi:MAG: STAS domain-containing protein [Chthoniobacterales bacterium]